MNINEIHAWLDSTDKRIEQVMSSIDDATFDPEAVKALTEEVMTEVPRIRIEDIPKMTNEQRVAVAQRVVPILIASGVLSEHARKFVAGGTKQ